MGRPRAAAGGPAARGPCGSCHATGASARVDRRCVRADPDIAAAGAVVVAGSLIGRKVGMHPKRQDDWPVVPNLWGAVVGRPSLMKSPALAEVMKPLVRLVAEAYETDVMVAEATKAALKDELKKAAKEAAKNGDRSKLEKIARRSQDTEVPE